MPSTSHKPLLRRAIIVFISALAVVGAAELAMRAFYPDLLRHEGWPSSPYVERASTVADFGTAEVALVGASVVDSGIDPAVLSGAWDGQAIFNAGLGGASPADYIAWTRNFVIPRLDPDVVVLGAMEFMADSPTCNLCLTDIRPYRVLAGTASLVDRLPGQELDLVLHGQDLLRPFDAPGDVEAIRLIEDRRVRRRDGLAVFDWPDFSEVTVEDPAMHPDNEAALRDFVEELRAQGREVAIVYVPTLATYDPERRPQFLAFEAVWAGIAAETGAHFVPLPATGFDSQSQYRDTSHLTGDAVADYSRWLGAQLAALGAGS